MKNLSSKLLKEKGEWFLLILITLNSIATISFSQDATTIYKEAVNSTVLVSTDISQGSGFFIGTNLIVTNYHVVKGASSAEVKLNDETTHEIEGFVSASRYYDIVILKVKDEVGKALQYDISTPQIGEKVYVFGSPLGLQSTISDGIISSLRTLNEKLDLIQMTAPISPGNSGGPVLNSKGKLIGVSTMSLEAEGAQNMNFAIPIKYVEELLLKLHSITPIKQIINPEQTNPTASDDLISKFSQLALEKMDDLGKYLKIIGNKDNDSKFRDKAINAAVDLFIDENAIVEIGSLNRKEIFKRPIRIYLNRIKSLNYDKVEIEWSNIQYVSDFKEAPDGKWYGVIAITQTFKGFKDGKLIYSDKSVKYNEVILKKIEKQIGREKVTDAFRLYLSDIKVQEISNYD